MEDKGKKGKPCKAHKGGKPLIFFPSLSIREKPIKKGLLLNQIKKAGLSVEEFLEYYHE